MLRLLTLFLWLYFAPFYLMLAVMEHLDWYKTTCWRMTSSMRRCASVGVLQCGAVSQAPLAVHSRGAKRAEVDFDLEAETIWVGK
ncbi:hypothetical protein BDR05DRAFT_276309 [Suillus weaverae]|nr:hypothetical protein BDR05DRAFT_276309 [Suillus weaverae]